MRIWRAAAPLALAIWATGCATDVAGEDVDSAQGRYADRPFDWAFGSSLIEPATKGPIKIRVKHGPTNKPWETWSKTAVMKWLEVLRALPGGDTLTREVVFVDRGEDLTVNVHAGGGRARYIAQIGWIKAFINVYEDSNDLTTVIHEVGHAFGLGDTYVEGVWTCAPDQVDSVMCNSWVEDLRADDVRGIRHQYCRRTKRCDADAYLDTYGGGGGTQFRTTCALGERLVGIDVRSGLLVDSFANVCENTATNVRHTMARIGGDGGATNALLACAPGAFVTAIDIRSDSLVNSLQVVCSDGTTTARAGGGGGRSDRVYSCPGPDGFPAVIGLRGAHGSYIDRLGLSCDVASGRRFAAGDAENVE